MPVIGMNAPVYSGLLTGALSVTKAGASAGFGYLNGSFPFSGGPAGPAPFGYLAEHVPGGGATPCSTRRPQVRPAAPPWCGNTTRGDASNSESASATVLSAAALVIMDAGYSAAALTAALAGPPVHLLIRLAPGSGEMENCSRTLTRRGIEGERRRVQPVEDDGAVQVRMHHVVTALGDDLAQPQRGAQLGITPHPDIANARAHGPDLLGHRAELYNVTTRSHAWCISG